MLGILGGTFDPVHNGHLHIAQAALTTLALQSVHFIPCNQPAHRTPPVANASQRLEMVQLATKHSTAFIADPTEIKRGGISYSIDTLKTLADTDKLCLLLGADAFLHFDQWHQWHEILTYTHLILINRPGFTLQLPPALTDWYKHNHTTNPDDLIDKHQGVIYELPVTPSNISATTIRNRIKNNQTVQQLLPHEVFEYIQKKQLYR